MNENIPPGLAPFCTEDWQRFPPIFPQFFCARKHSRQRSHKKLRRTEGIYGKIRKLRSAEERVI